MSFAHTLARAASFVAALVVSLPAVSVPSVDANTPAVPEPVLGVMGQESVVGVTRAVVRVEHAAGSIGGALFLPSSGGAHPGLLLLHDGTHGIDRALEQRARDLAALGYVVMVPEYRSGGACMGRASENATEVGDVLVAAAALVRHPQVYGEQVGVLGTSHGAFVAMLAVMQEPKRFRCVAQASGAVDVPRTASKVRIPVLLQHGWKDDVVEIGDAMYLSAEMRRSGNATARLKEYSLLGHNLWFAHDPAAFTPDQVAQAEWAWEDLTVFLGTYMQRGRSGAGSATNPVAAGAGGSR